jgi:hypothetical protein
VRVDEGHAELLAGFYRATWDAGATASGVRAARRRAAAANPVAPGEEVPTFLFVAGGRALGHLTTLPVRLWNGGRLVAAHWLKGLMVLPEARNGPVGYYLLREAVRHLPVTMAMVVAPEARRLFGAVGFAELGTLPDTLRVLEPGRVLARLDAEALAGSLPPWARGVLPRLQRSPAGCAVAGWLASAALAAWSAVADSPRTHRGWVLPELPAGDAARLWVRMRRLLAAAPARDAARLAARYGEAGYRLVGVRERGELVALGAVRPPRPGGDPRLHGIRLATLSELLCLPGHSAAARALLATAEQVARGLEADALLCAASHVSMAQPLRRRAYLRAPGSVHVLLRAPADAGLPGSIARWWLTRGDSNADEGF